MRGLTIPQIKRLVQLRRAGLSCPATATVLNLDYGVETTPNKVRCYSRKYAPDTISASHRERLKRGRVAA